MRGMRRKLKTKIIVLAILKCFLMLYFVYLHPDSRIGYWRMLIGGLQVADSKFIFRDASGFTRFSPLSLC